MASHMNPFESYQREEKSTPVSSSLGYSSLSLDYSKWQHQMFRQGIHLQERHILCIKGLEMARCYSLYGQNLALNTTSLSDSIILPMLALNLKNTTRYTFSAFEGNIPTVLWRIPECFYPIRK